MRPKYWALYKNGRRVTYTYVKEDSMYITFQNYHTKELVSIPLITFMARQKSELFPFKPMLIQGGKSC